MANQGLPGYQPKLTVTHKDNPEVKETDGSVTILVVVYCHLGGPKTMIVLGIYNQQIPRDYFFNGL